MTDPSEIILRMAILLMRENVQPAHAVVSRRIYAEFRRRAKVPSNIIVPLFVVVPYGPRIELHLDLSLEPEACYVFDQDDYESSVKAGTHDPVFHLPKGAKTFNGRKLP